MEIQIDEQPLDAATHIQIDIVYQQSSAGKIAARTQVAFSGVHPVGYTSRVTCGLLFMALGCFELRYGVSEEPLPEGYTDRILVSTQTRQVFASTPNQASNVISEVIAFHARELGIAVEVMPEAMIARLIGEAVEVLNGVTSAKVNAVGGVA